MSTDTKSTGVKRREFLKVLGASSAAVAAAGCSEPTGKLIPYLISPDETVPGVSTYYATTCRECAAACGVISETRDGRSIKLEGNPDHPLSRGALCARGQSALQGLYNPDRFRGPMIRSGSAWRSVTWDEALALVSQKLGAAKGSAANAVFVNQHESGSFPVFLDQWLAGYGMKPHLSVDFEADHAAMAAHRQAYGSAWPRWSFADAKLVVSFGADFLDGWGPSVPQQLDFADARAKLDQAPRFVYVGARRSLTGLNADSWIPCRPGTELAVVNFLRGQGSADQVAQTSGVPAEQLQQLAQELASAKPALVLAGGGGPDGAELAAAAAELTKASGGTAAVRAGEGAAGFEGMSTHAELLDAIERMRSGQVPIAFFRGVNPAHSLPASLRFDDALAKVPFKVSFSSYPDETTELCDVVLPDFHALESWGDAQSVTGTISLQQPVMDPVFANTRQTADALIMLAKKDPAAAGRFAAIPDYRTWLMARLPGGAQGVATALGKGTMPGTIAGRAAPTTPAIARRQAPQAQGDFFLVVYPSATLGVGRGANKPWLQELPDPVTKVVWGSWVEIHPETATAKGIERGDMLEVTTGDGRTVRAPAFPYLGVRPDTVALALGQGHHAYARLDAFDPKHSGNAIQWGYGRYARDVGVNAMDLVAPSTDAAGGFVRGGMKATIRKTGDTFLIASTEGSARQHGRGIAQALTVAELLRGGTGAGDSGARAASEAAPNGGPEEGGHGGSRGEAGAPTQERGAEEELPGDASHAFLPGLRSPVAADAQGSLGAPTDANQGKNKGLYDPNNPLGMAKRRWAMTIDLARCTGCSACVTACYAENNIPTVGAAWQNATVYADARAGFNVTRGREMNWIRLERYFEGADDAKFGQEFEARFVPMLCQQCGNAPCEPVCPVYATYHSPDGLNVQVYNRCVGTRYCSNNCPYKVRYFNWFGYGEQDRKQYAFPEPLNWQLNPDVTVRGKGVMEKCSFCVQRIREAENRAVTEQRELQADEFTTACAAACPSRAITFGDAADESWTVAKLAQDRRAYHVFEELNTYTAVVYLKKVNHPSPAAARTATPAVR